jgi:hypothetical protein
MGESSDFSIRVESESFQNAFESSQVELSQVKLFFLLHRVVKKFYHFAISIQ